MRAIILAGGLGTRISEETESKPKPMVLIGDKPILWHVMNIYASQGITDFIIATGYKSEVIHDWVSTLKESWSIKPIDTGLETQTAGRIKQCIQSVQDPRFFVTYGDGLGNIDLEKLLLLHERSSKIATVTAVRPPARFGVLESNKGEVIHFGEKRQTDAGWINGGFFVVENEIANLIKQADESFEAFTLPKLVTRKQLGAYHHEGYWQPMDTLREKNILTELASSGSPPWFQS